MVTATAELAKAAATDILIYQSGVTDESSALLHRAIDSRPTKRDNVCVFLQTSGGSADAAYQIAKKIRSSYPKGKITIIVDGYCKSAGTLLSIIANELVVPDDAEMGPLDVQLLKPDQIVGERTSGLTPFQALLSLQEQVFSDFESHFLQIIRRSLGNITTKTAAEIATRMVVGLYEPIYAQIDPMKLGETARAMSIAHAYGIRLGEHNLNVGGLDMLVSGYPSHSFVLDRDELHKVFKCVRPPTAQEAAVLMSMQYALEVLLEEVEDARGLVGYLLEELPHAQQTVGCDPHAQQPAPPPGQPGGDAAPPPPEGSGGDPDPGNGAAPPHPPSADSPPDQP